MRAALNLLVWREDISSPLLQLGACLALMMIAPLELLSWLSTPAQMCVAQRWEGRRELGKS